MLLNENDWQAINHILLKMYSEKTDALFDGEFMIQLQYLIPYDKASFYLHDHLNPDQILCTDRPEIIGFNLESYKKYPTMIPTYVPHTWANFYEHSLVIRDSDVFDEEERKRTFYYSTLYNKDNVEFALTISLAHSQSRVGILSLFRDKGRSDFSDREVKIAEQLMDHIACYTYNVYHLDQYAANKKHVKTVAEVINQYGLSEREIEVLRLVLVGYSTKEISNRLCITETTAKKHLGSIYNKMSIRGKSELFKVLNFNFDL